mmetsp:Transcript_18416/g.43142  ORF Transcript_18416/g.43142 Transcript_18416/m.43142 type:complete len:101 (+) Transcript_18416:25-327(+)
MPGLEVCTGRSTRTRSAWRGAACRSRPQVLCQWVMLFEGQAVLTPPRTKQDWPAAGGPRQGEEGTPPEVATAGATIAARTVTADSETEHLAQPHRATAHR